jgi:hypothetical protein
MASSLIGKVARLATKGKGKKAPNKKTRTAKSRAEPTKEPKRPKHEEKPGKSVKKRQLKKNLKNVGKKDPDKWVQWGEASMAHSPEDMRKWEKMKGSWKKGGRIKSM